MKNKKLLALIPSLFLLVVAIIVAFKYIKPPGSQIVISTSTDEGDYQTYAKLYQDIIKDEGVNLIIRPSAGAVENLHRLEDPHSDVDAGFLQDGLAATSENGPDLVSLGSLYYEPVWVFYGQGVKELTRFSQLMGKKIAIGHPNSGTAILTKRLLKGSEIDEKNAKFFELGWQDALDALNQGKVDAAFFIATPEDALIQKMMLEKNIHLMNVDQAEAITRKISFLHHLVLPHGAINLSKNIPAQDVNLVSPTATLVVRDSLNPALVNLLLKAASQVHGEPGIFEKKNEFPIDKDDEFALSDEAKRFYKSGAPFWQRFLPFWIAVLIERFLIVMLPLIAVVYPMVKMIPKLLDRRVRNKIHKQYGELQFLETMIKSHSNQKDLSSFLPKLDRIEDQVNQLNLPIEYSEHIYVLREHIDFVRKRCLTPF